MPKLKSYIEKELFNVLFGFRKEFIIVGLFSSLANLLMLAPSIYMLQVYDRVMVSRSELTLIALSLLIVFLYFVLVFCEWLRGQLIVHVSARIDRLFANRIFEANFQDKLSGSARVPTQALSDLMLIRQWLTGTGVIAFFDLPWSPIYIGVMFLLHPFLGWLSISFTIVLIILAWLTSFMTSSINEEADEEEKELNSLIFSKLRNADVIEIHGMVPGLRIRWWKRQFNALHAGLKANDLNNRMSVISKELRLLMQSLALGGGAMLVINTELGVGSMVVSSMLMSRVTAPLDSIVSGWKGFVNVKSAFKRVNDLLNTFPLVETNTNVEAIQGNIELIEFSATAQHRSKPILNNISVKFDANMVYAVVGPSGSGKSTLGKVILGIWPQYKGKITLDDFPIKNWKRDVLGQQVGYLPQDIELFRGTVAQNVARLGKVDPNSVIEATTQAGIHDMILHMPNGYDTQIGDGGSFLSGGQRQRIALARAIYGNPRLVVLDEPNANLDDAGENALIDCLNVLKSKGATVFLITHRPLIMKYVDKVIYMRNGLIDKIETCGLAQPKIDVTKLS